MSTEQYDYLSLENDKDKNEPLISDNSVLRNDSSHSFEENNSRRSKR